MQSKVVEILLVEDIRPPTLLRKVREVLRAPPSTE